MAPLIRPALAQYVNARQRRLQALDALDAVADRTSSSSSERWSRESLHERTSG